MPTTDRDRLRKAIRRMLTDSTRGAPAADSIAEATVSTCRRISARLAPVIGAQGVGVLFSRSLHLTMTAFPWLAAAGEHRDSAALFESLKTSLAGSETAAAADASAALLVTFVTLLATLIGASLTERLLGPVWASPPPSPEGETES